MTKHNSQPPALGLLSPVQPGDGEGWFTLRHILTFHQGLLIWKKGEQGQGWLAKSRGRNEFLTQLWSLLVDGTCGFCVHDTWLPVGTTTLVTCIMNDCLRCVNIFWEEGLKYSCQNLLGNPDVVGIKSPVVPMQGLGFRFVSHTESFRNL